jgi:hypothetical protein
VRFSLYRLRQLDEVFLARDAEEMARQPRTERTALMGEPRQAVGMERYSASYIAFAMEPEKFAQLEPDVNRAEAAGNIFVEIANKD